MSQTYKAVLRGDRLEWRGAAPEQIKGEKAVDVYVTILQDSDGSSDRMMRGARMADALEQLAAINAFAEIFDPVTWQRKQREDRPVPGRE